MPLIPLIESPGAAPYAERITKGRGETPFGAVMKAIKLGSTNGSSREMGVVVIVGRISGVALGIAMGVPEGVGVLARVEIAGGGSVCSSDAVSSSPGVNNLHARNIKEKIARTMSRGR